MKKRVIQTHGVCDDYAKQHPAHTFVHTEYETHLSVWDCPGVYVDCINCDDRKCMDCVLRHVHDSCEDSCPMCCRKGDK